MTTETPSRLAYSPAEVGEMLGITTQTVYKMIARGDLKAVRFGTRNYRIMESALREFVDQRSTE